MILVFRKRLKAYPHAEYDESILIPGECKSIVKRFILGYLLRCKVQNDIREDEKIEELSGFDFLAKLKKD